MPHQCVKCGALHDNTSDALIKGCNSCHSKMFFFVKDTDLEKAKERTKNLTSDQRTQMEKDVYDILGEDPAKHMPVILEFESINILEPGKYELDIVNLFKEGHPIVYKLEEGKYMIDLPETFKKLKPNQKNTKKNKK
ncbi:MAG: Zn-ribbon domain-containing protein [Candidatus Nanoarchaeia archaeon]